MPAYDFFLEANLNSEKKKQMLGHPSQAERNYHILGVPLRTGSLYPGNENDAQAYREVQLIA
ncbi:MAG: hypothetical protein H6Q42_4732, partial [Deltaproteobacteria bacterium]|nr:hypothetical protein [Deltaproteobacteria bacterium]